MLESGSFDARNIAQTHPAFQLYFKEHEEAAAADLKDLKFIVDERERNGALEHLCVFDDERTEWISVPENTGALAEYKKCKAANPGKKGPEIIECLKEWMEPDLVEE